MKRSLLFCFCLLLSAICFAQRGGGDDAAVDDEVITIKREFVEMRFVNQVSQVNQVKRRMVAFHSGQPEKEGTIPSFH